MALVEYGPLNMAHLLIVIIAESAVLLTVCQTNVS